MRLGKRAYAKLVYQLLRMYRTCELCGRVPAESFHHVVPRGQGGDDCLENGAALCGDGVRGCHGEVERAAEARSRLRYAMRPECAYYAIERKGLAWFDRRYPAAPA